MIIGGDHYFRFNHPASVDPCSKRTSTGAPKDFQFAKQEIEKTQNDRYIYSVAVNIDVLRVVPAGKQRGQLLLR